MKFCPKCKTEKQENEFYRDRSERDGLTYRCKTCMSAASKQYDIENRDVRVAYKSDRHLRKRHGITRESYQTLLTSQASGCAICGTTEPGGRWNQFSVDHDHVTGEVRGLLCDSCNLGLGKFGDNPSRLMAAAQYLIDWRKYE